LFKSKNSDLGKRGGRSDACQIAKDGLISNFMPTYSELANHQVLSQPVYEAGRPIEVVAREFGLDPSSVIKLASNENPLGPSPLGLAAAKKALESAHLYPDGGSTFLREKLAKTWSMQPNQFVIGNGSNEVMILLAQAFLRPGSEVIFGSQAFVVYKLATLMQGATPVEVPMPNFCHDLKAMRAAVTDKTRILFLASPNNPTGGTDNPQDIVELAKSLPDHVIFCLDEAYTEYLDSSADLRELINAGRKVVVTRTFSKAYGLAGLRVGYLMGSSEICGLLNRVRQPFNVSLPALAAAEAALDDQEFLNRSKKVNAEGIKQMSQGLKALGFKYIDGKANFLAAQIPNAEDAFIKLQKVGVIVRPLKGYGMTGWLRLTIGTEAQNARLLSELKKL
jgi:histidinol-phosphate aminotransferase